MSIAATSYRPNVIDNKVLKNLGRIFTMVSSSPKADTGFEDDMLSFSTIDGSMVAYKSGANAVNAGAGIFVGGYFVGGADDNALSDESMPFIKY
ncbi:hypothetical protein DXT99_12160 [Pontibacter diazotrophicus]|uniref:Uncharacterized protein n=1 Tax=Pontibacter diazotrophicus TaxID=1400979 RepID=A0A3D8LC88_9BACT|nr:hypothetical protein [Pontibacter diazotrophicus]RDV15027.1 hypothetical protein DXT99_12160 [Pontibacter diazotrophicus]